MKTYTAGAEKLQAFLRVCFKAPPIFSIIGAVFLSKPKPNLNTTVGFDMKMTLQTPPPPTETTKHIDQTIAYF